MRLPKVSEMRTYKDSQLSLLVNRVNKEKDRRVKEAAKKSEAKKAVADLQAKYGATKVKQIAGVMK